MLYKVIGIMSGSSLDGLDIAYCHIEESRGQWTYTIQAAACIPYSAQWQQDLQGAAQKSVADFLELHSAYGRYIGDCVNAFVEEQGLDLKVDFIVSHGHTVHHNPAKQTSFQLGCGASIAATTQLQVINDLRAMDVALQGQGAPIVPIGDYFLFHPYAYLLNLGGIANITIKQGQSMLAFDIGVANQALNYYAQKRGLAYDDKGNMAAKGILHTGLAAKLAEHPYYKIQGPKSLSNAQAMELIAPLMEEENLSVEDALHTLVHVLVERIAEALQAHPIPENAALLVTGGGAFNDYLVQQLRVRLQAYGIETVVPDALVVQYKEALIMAFIGVLRWREELNVLKSVTGAQRSSIGGAFWMGA